MKGRISGSIGLIPGASAWPACSALSCIFCFGCRFMQRMQLYAHYAQSCTFMASGFRASALVLHRGIRSDFCCRDNAVGSSRPRGSKSASRTSALSEMRHLIIYSINARSPDFDYRGSAHFPVVEHRAGGFWFSRRRMLLRKEGFEGRIVVIHRDVAHFSRRRGFRSYMHWRSTRSSARRSSLIQSHIERFQP